MKKLKFTNPETLHNRIEARLICINGQIANHLAISKFTISDKAMLHHDTSIRFLIARKNELLMLRDNLSF